MYIRSLWRTDMKAVIGSVMAALLLGCSIAATAAPTVPSDKTLDKRIEHRFRIDRTLKRYSIDVDVKDHVATLTGTVPSDATKVRAARLATVRGVTRVDNQ